MIKGDVITDGVMAWKIIRLGKLQATIKCLHPSCMGVKIKVTLHVLNIVYKLV